MRELFATVGWALSSIIFIWIARHFGDDFYVFIAGFVSAGVYSAFLDAYDRVAGRKDK